VYRTKDAVEKCFDDLKNQLDMRRLRIPSLPAIDGRLVQFVARILISALSKKMREMKRIDSHTLREVLLEMGTLSGFASPESTARRTRKIPSLRD
jgi:transposase